MDVTAWLRELVLKRYEQAFHDNDIDAAVLPELTADDLIWLGVTSIGHRRKMLVHRLIRRSDSRIWAAVLVRVGSRGAPGPREGAAGRSVGWRGSGAD